MGQAKSGLIIRTSDGRNVDVGTFPAIIGRGPEAQVAFSNLKLRPKHAKIMKVNQRFLVESLCDEMLIVGGKAAKSHYVEYGSIVELGVDGLTISLIERTAPLIQTTGLKLPDVRTALGALLGVAMLALLVVAIRGWWRSDVPPPEIPVAISLQVGPADNKLELQGPGTREKLRMRIQFADGHEEPVQTFDRIAFSANDIVALEGEFLRPLANGEVTLTVHVGELKDDLTVSVSGVENGGPGTGTGTGSKSLPHPNEFLVLWGFDGEVSAGRRTQLVQGGGIRIDEAHVLVLKSFEGHINKMAGLDDKPTLVALLDAQVFRLTRIRAQDDRSPFLVYKSEDPLPFQTRLIDSIPSKGAKPIITILENDELRVSAWDKVPGLKIQFEYLKAINWKKSVYIPKNTDFLDGQYPVDLSSCSLLFEKTENTVVGVCVDDRAVLAGGKLRAWLEEFHK